MNDFYVIVSTTAKPLAVSNHIHVDAVTNLAEAFHPNGKIQVQCIKPCANTDMAEKITNGMPSQMIMVSDDDKFEFRNDGDVSSPSFFARILCQDFAAYLAVTLNCRQPLVA